MNLKDVVTFIITDPIVKDEGMTAVITAIKERQKINRQHEKAVASAILRVGSEVTVKNIRPKYLNGMKGTIVAFNKTRTRADIRITDNLHDYRVMNGATKHGFPLTCLDLNAPKTVIGAEDEGILADFIDGAI